MRIISMSLFGDNDLYWKGALENVECWHKHYPEWKMRVYVEQNNETIAPAALELAGQGVEVIGMPNPGGFHGTFWRFLAASDPAAEYVIVRDADSRLNARERAAVDEWIASGKALHVMRDHPQHSVPIMGGMWGVRGGVITNMAEQIAAWGQWYIKGVDQDFLAWKVWPALRHDCMEHGERGAPFPPHDPIVGFVGMTIGPRPST